jgi:hypothetical protein
LNALRRYPLREGCSALSSDGQFRLPDTLIVDFSLAASSDASRRFYVSKVFNKLTAVILEISDNIGEPVGVVEIDATSHVQDSDYYITPTNSYIGAGGRITIGTLTDLAQQPAGSFEFSQSATEFETRTIIPSLQGVDRIEFIDSKNGSSSLTGNVKITARNNVNFSYSGVLEYNRVFLDVGDGLGLNKPCDSTNPIRTINGISPDDSGNISFLGVSCVKVSSQDLAVLDIEDTCCTPCSGCNDLEELTLRLTTLEARLLDLKTNYSMVNAHLSTYLSTINSNCACPA